MCEETKEPESIPWSKAREFLAYIWRAEPGKRQAIEKIMRSYKGRDIEN